MITVLALAAILVALVWVLFFRRSADKSRMGLWRVRTVTRTADLVPKTCKRCKGSGDISLADGTPIGKREVNANSVTCPGPCRGMGWYYVKKESGE